MNTPYAGFANCCKCSKSFYAIPANGRKVRGKWVCNDHNRPTKDAPNLEKSAASDSESNPAQKRII